MGAEVAISTGLLARARADALLQPGLERCGLLFGSHLRITDAEAVRNVADEPWRRFELDPGALLAAHRRARAGGPKVIGHYHSHPSGLPLPSPEDAQAAAGDGALWLILTSGGTGLFRAVSGGALHGAFDVVRLFHG